MDDSLWRGKRDHALSGCRTVVRSCGRAAGRSYGLRSNGLRSVRLIASRFWGEDVTAVHKSGRLRSAMRRSARRFRSTADFER